VKKSPADIACRRPAVYSDAEVAALLAAALALPPKDRLRRWTYHTLFGLIAVTGMRLSEVMGLAHRAVRSQDVAKRAKTSIRVGEMM
jgi:site-specific recombinase XerD